jgi:DNA polymerase-3 subunit beta
MPECEIEINADEKNAVTIKGGASDFTIHGLAAEAFPNLPELAGDRSFSITQGLLKEMISSTIFAVAQIDARPILTGELFQIEENKLTIVALDGARLALRQEKNAIFDNKETFRFVVPGKSLSDLCKLITDNDEMMKVEFTRKHIVFRIGDVIFFSRLLEGEYLDYTRALPQQSKIFVEVERSEFIESVERASLLVDERLKTPLRFRFEDNLLHVFCSTQYGKVNDQVRIKKEGDDIEISFNNRYLLDALRACPDDKFVLGLKSSLSPCTIRPVEGNRFTYLVLPVRLKAGN